MSTTIAIAGISSTLAQLITKALLQRPEVYIRGSSRDINKLPEDLKNSPRISLVQSDTYDTKTLQKLVHGCDVVICCYFASSEVMLEGQKVLIDLCEEEGIARYIASDYTVDFRNLEPTDIAVKNFTKDVQAYLQKKSTVKGIHILIGTFMETFLDIFGVWEPEKKEIRYWGSGKEKWDLTSYQTAAEYVAAVALDPSACGFFKFRGDNKSAVGIADDIKTVYGFGPAMQCNGSLDDIAQQLDSAGNVKNTLLAATYFLLTGKIAFGEDIDNAKYPHVKPEVLSAVLQQRLKKQD